MFRSTAAGIAFWLVLAGAAIAFEAPKGEDDGPKYNAKGEMLFPDNYREWVWLSSGLGMTYGPLAESSGNQNPPFDNVFVNRAAYRSFLASGKWPDKSVFVLEVRASASNGSINKGGHFQGGLNAVEVHVKDEARFPGKWAFFSFEKPNKPGTLFPTSASCYSCHEKHGAVDTTFVQFYPTLIDIAKQKRTYLEAATSSR